MFKRKFRVLVWLIIVVYGFVFGVNSGKVYVSASTYEHKTNTGKETWKLLYLDGENGVVIPIFETGVAYVATKDYYKVSGNKTTFTKRKFYYYVTDSTGIKYGSVNVKMIYTYRINGENDINFGTKKWTREDGMFQGGVDYFSFGSLKNGTDVSYTKSEVKKLSNKIGVLIYDSGSITGAVTVSATSSLSSYK